MVNETKIDGNFNLIRIFEWPKQNYGLPVGIKQGEGLKKGTIDPLYPSVNKINTNDFNLPKFCSAAKHTGYRISATNSDITEKNRNKINWI